MRALATSVPADQSGESSLYADPAFVIPLRFVAGVRRIETDRSTLAMIGFKGRFLIVDQRYDDLTIARRVDLPDQREITVEDPFVDHGVARHLQGIMLARTEQGSRYGEAFSPL